MDFIIIYFGADCIVKYLICICICIAFSFAFPFILAASNFSTFLCSLLAFVILVIVDPNSTLALFPFGSIVAFVVAFSFIFNNVVVFVAVFLVVPPHDSEANVKGSTKEEATEEMDVECSS